MPKLFIIFYTWPNTAGNHAGMAYLAKELKNSSPKKVKLVEIPQNINSWPIKLQRLHFYLLSVWLRITLTRMDKLLFMEFLGNRSGNQTGIAIKLRKWGVKNWFVGLVHLSGSNLLELYGNTEYLKKGTHAVDNILVLGSSLARFFAELGYEKKVITTFHYVDTSFYKPSSNPKSEKIQVIHMGSIKRNFEKLKEIVIACPEIDFHICQGYNNLTEYFKDKKNVTLYGYLNEEDLLRLMQICHISLSILDDTIGSNVITTSMACGLVNIVSDVGSIKDYCDENEAILCKTPSDFILSLKSLMNDPQKIIYKRNMSLLRSKDLSLNKSINFFINLAKYE